MMKTLMKSMLIVLFGITMATVLAACGGDNSGGDNSDGNGGGDGGSRLNAESRFFVGNWKMTFMYDGGTNYLTISANGTITMVRQYWLSSGKQGSVQLNGNWSYEVAGDYGWLRTSISGWNEFLVDTKMENYWSGYLNEGSDRVYVSKLADDDLAVNHIIQSGTQWIQCTSCYGNGVCRSCSGNGTSKCIACSGTGYIIHLRYNETCTNCNGTGYKTCTSCSGTGKCSACGGSGGHYE